MQIKCMTKKKPSGASPDRHKPSRTVRLRLPYALVLDELAKRDAKTTSDLVNDIVLEWLKAKNLWPRPGPEALRSES